MESFDAAVTPLAERMLVEASAGTGKTYAITTLFVRLLLETGLDVDRILVVTFTEAATAELRDRIRSRLRQAARAFATGASAADPTLAALVAASADRARDGRRLAAALRNVDTAAVFTIHGFCHRVLHDSAFESRVLFDQELVTDLRDLRDQVVGDYWVRALLDAPLQQAAWLEECGVRPSTSGSLVDRAVATPELRLVPEPGGVVADWQEPWADALEVARASWDAEAVEWLLGHARLYKNYGQAEVPERCRRMSAFLADPPSFPQLPAPLDKFCLSVIHKRVLKGGTTPVHPFFEACDALRVASELGRAAGRDWVVGFQHELVRFARAELPRRKEERCAVSFDDLLLMVREALAGEAGRALGAAVRRRYPAALVDEFQDTDPLQYEIFSTLYGGESGGEPARLMMVGDPKQAIYSFRGADVFAYLRATEQTPAEQRFTMPYNWRSGPSLVRAVGRLFERPRLPFLLEGIGYPGVAAQPDAGDILPRPLEVLFVPRESGEKQVSRGWARHGVPSLVAAEIADTLRRRERIGDGEITPGSIAVLTRTNAQAFEVQEALRKLRVPSVVLGDKSVFGQPEAEELGRVLAAVAEPTNNTALRTALITDLLGVTANDLQAMETRSEAWDVWVRDFRDWNALWAGKGFVQMVRALMARRQVQERLLGLEGGERRVTNLLHLVELLHTAATALHLGPVGLLHWLALQRGDDGYAAEANQIRLESDERAVKITTVHKAKGLEYDVVYCPYLWDGWLLHSDDHRALLFHDPDAGDRACLDVDPDRGEDSRSMALCKREKMSENLRLLYVALTRARHRCTVVWGGFRNSATSSLGYVLHPPGELTELSVDAVETAAKGRSDSEMLADLEQLAAESGGAIAVRAVSRTGRGEVWEPDAEPARALSCRRPARPVDRSWRMASFTQLAASAAGPVADERERDELAVDLAAPEGPAAAPVVLAEFPRGARAGNFFHDLLEHLDFTRPELLEPLVAGKLRAHGFATGTWAELVTAGLRQVLASPLGVEPELRLADLSAPARCNELEFHLPVAAAPPARPLLPGVLAAVFRDHAGPALPPDYAERVERLTFRALCGYLKGYIDMVFEHGGRYYVVDYKSNWLGADRADYRCVRLADAMMHGHYFLQSHLYTLAVHRHLARRVPDYDYDRHFGGVLYLFLRGMTPDGGTGVFRELPPPARIEALGRALDGAGTGSVR